MLSAPRAAAPYLIVGMVLVLGAACAPADGGIGERIGSDVAAAASHKSRDGEAAHRAAYIAARQRNAPSAYGLEVSAVPGWATGTNPAHRFQVAFGDAGVRIESDVGSCALRFRLSGYGREDRLQPVPSAPAVAVRDNEAHYARGADLMEWYANGPLGLEHGMTLLAPPDGSGRVVLEVAFEGARPVFAAEDEPVSLVGDAGNRCAHYGELYASDADGRTLGTRMQLVGDAVRLVVDDAGARYPLAIDPLMWIEQQKLLASDGAAEDWFGFSVSVSGDTAVIGAANDDDKGFDSGSGYVFVRSGSVWTQEQKLLASDGAAEDWLGRAVSVSGDTIIIGAIGHDDNAPGSGSAYVFVRNGRVWTEQQKLLASDGASYDIFGDAVSIDGDTAVIGASHDDDAGLEAGSAYVFVRSGSVWTMQQKLLASDAADEDSFGVSVSVSGDTAVIGAYGDDDYGLYTGSAYVFVRSGSVWTEQQKLLASDGATYDVFGTSVSVSGGIAVIGAPQNESGAAYVFERSGSVWTEKQKLVASDGGMYIAQFGYSVSVSADTALIGALLDGDNGPTSGSAYVFVRSGSAWNEQQKLLASDAADGDQFGHSVSVSGDTAVMSATWSDDNGLDSGSAYGFLLSKTVGEPCVAATECASGVCADGLCCESACSGTCEACDLPANEGSCTVLAAGDDPDEECDAGACNGAGACAFDEGQTCAMPAECLSGFCVNGRCCESACGGGCGRCDVAANEGTCAPVPQGSPGEPPCAGGCVCDGTDTACPTSSVDDAQCVDGSTCTSNSDCVTGFICSSSGRCVAAEQASEGCSGCRLGARPEHRSKLLLLLVGAGVAALRRRRPRASWAKRIR